MSGISNVIKVLLLNIIFITVLSSTPSSVVGDFTILNDRTGKTVFQTASDEVIDGCSSLYESANIFAYFDPPKDCSVTVLPWLYRKGQHIVLVTKEREGCGLRSLRESAAEAGFSAIIYGTEKGAISLLSLAERIALKNRQDGDVRNDGLIDVHLVNPFDINIISRNFSNNPGYSLSNNLKPTCKRAEKTSAELHWLFLSNWIKYLSKIAWVDIKDRGHHLLTENPILFQVFILPVSGLICVALLFLFSKALYWLAYYFPTPGSSTRDPNPPRFNYEYVPNSEPDWDFESDDKTVSELRKHCENLGVPWTGEENLKEEEINHCFRRKALLYHPDKNPDCSESEVASLREKFEDAQKSREFLLKYVSDHNK